MSWLPNAHWVPYELLAIVVLLWAGFSWLWNVLVEMKQSVEQLADAVQEMRSRQARQDRRDDRG